MSKFNTPAAARSRAQRGTSPLGAASPTASDARTHEGGAAYSRDARSELFLATSAAFVAEDSFYELAADRLDRVARLVDTIVGESDGLDWLVDFVTWLRGEGNMRTAPGVLAAEVARAASSLDIRPRVPDSRPQRPRSAVRRIADAACQRADEPGEIKAYWDARAYGTMPRALQRGLADAAARLYTEYATLKYDSPTNAVRFGDIVSLYRPTPPPGRSALFKHLIERRHPGWRVTPDSDALLRHEPLDADALPMLAERDLLNAVPVEQRRAMLLDNGSELAARMRAAGATWEWLSGWLADGQGMDAAAWKAALPHMGYMARLRNLANFDRQGMDDETAAIVGMMLANREQVAKSRQFPFRFLSAYRNVPSDRWSFPLSKALDYSLGNIPEMPGDTLVMIDTSASMQSSMGVKPSRGRRPGATTPRPIDRVDAAALFGLAVANRNPGRVDVYGFADHAYQFDVTPGASVLREMAHFVRTIGTAGHGTMIEESTGAAYRRKRDGKYARVFVFTDEQSFGSDHWGYRRDWSSTRIPDSVPIYAFNLAGYAAGILPAGRNGRYQLGGLTDATFRMVSTLERGGATGWPWQDDAR